MRTAALVTNLAVHFKLGRESSLVWVTRLDDGKPVEGARVDVRDCAGRRYWSSTTGADGLVLIGKALPGRDRLPDCNTDGRTEYFVTARLEQDLAFAFSDWGEGIAPWRFNVPTGRWDGPFVAHAVLDRTLLRAGETVSMKLFVRRQTGDGFALVPRAPLPATLDLRHRGSERKYMVPVRWQSAQHGEAAFAIPPDALTGTYDIVLRDTLAADRREPQERRAGEFRVEAFRVPLLRARLQPVAMPWVRPKAIAFDVQVSHLSGGGAGGLPVRLRTALAPRTTSFPDFEGYAFATGNVTAGREERGDSVARFDGYLFAGVDAGEEDQDRAGAAAPAAGNTKSFTLDATGGGRITADVPAAIPAGDSGDGRGARDVPQDLVAELAYRDPNGETLTAATRVPLWPSRVLLAVKPDSWAAAKDRLKFTVAAVDLAGRPAAGLRVRVDAFKREYYSHRRRLIGGFYAYDYGSETTAVGSGELCAGETDAHGLLACDVTPACGGRPHPARAGAATPTATPPSPAPTPGSPPTRNGRSPAPTTTASTSCPNASATSRARRRASRCARRSRKRRCWSRSSARACWRRSCARSSAPTRCSRCR